MSILPIHVWHFSVYCHTNTDTDAPLLSQLEAGIKQEIETVGRLSVFASQYPYYK